MMRHLWLLLGFGLCFSWGYAQKPLAQDEVADSLLVRAKRFMERGQYLLALHTFEDVIDRDFHQRTTTAIYLAGLTAYRAEEWATALDYFNEILKEYPLSNFFEDAAYHKALVYLQAPQEYRQRQGLDSLLVMYEETMDDSLADLVLLAIRSFTFENASLRLLEDYYERVIFALKPVFLEPLVYHLVRLDDRENARSYYEDYIWQGGVESEYVEKILSEEAVWLEAERDIIKLAMVLPLFLEGVDTLDFYEDSLTSIPKKSQLAVSFYEGFKMAVEEQELEGEKKLMLKVIDSQRDSATVEAGLMELEQFVPDILIGEIYNQQSQQIAQWCENQLIPQIIPLSPTQELIEGRNQVFLAHPSVAQHGRKMAEYAWDSLQLNRIVVWTDLRAGTESLSQAFIETFEKQGGEIIQMVIDSVYNQKTVKDIQYLIDEWKKLDPQPDGVYIPILSNEETCGLILSLIDKHFGRKLAVMGSPHWWKRYKAVDRTLKERHQLLFTSSYMIDKEDTDYQAFHHTFAQRFGVPPNSYATQGYDLGRYVLAMMNHYKYDRPLADYVRDYPVYHALHADYMFDYQQSNQFVNIGQYQKQGIIKVNTGSNLDLKNLFEPEEK